MTLCIFRIYKSHEMSTIILVDQNFCARNRLVYIITEKVLDIHLNYMGLYYEKIPCKFQGWSKGTFQHTSFLWSSMQKQ